MDRVFLDDDFLYVIDLGLPKDEDVAEKKHPDPDAPDTSDQDCFKDPNTQPRRREAQLDLYSVGCIMLCMTAIMYGVASGRECKDLLNRYRLNPSKHRNETRNPLAPKSDQDGNDTSPSPELVELICSVLLNNPQDQPPLIKIIRELKAMSKDNAGYWVNAAYLGPCCEGPPAPAFPDAELQKLEDAHEKKIFRRACRAPETSGRTPTSVSNIYEEEAAQRRLAKFQAEKAPAARVEAYKREALHRMLGEHAATDPELKALLSTAAAGKATTDELKKSQAIADELAEIPKRREREALAAQEAKAKAQQQSGGIPPSLFDAFKEPSRSQLNISGTLS